MTHFLRHFAVRIWASLLAGCLLVLLGFPVLGQTPGLWVAFWSLLVCFLVCFYLCGWAGNTLGIRAVDRLMREAGIWERANNFRKAERVFKKAVSIFDSFLISPLVRQEKSRQLSARMARFYLTREDTGPEAHRFITAYLDRYPQDKEVSDAWLQKADPGALCLREDDDLIFKISQAQPDNPGLQRLLARACLLAGRSDYPALKAYRRIIEQPAATDRGIIADIATRFFRDRRADGWALNAYLLAFKADQKQTWLLKGMAACMQRASGNEMTLRHYMEAGKLLSRLDKDTLAKLEQGFATPPPPKAGRAIPSKTARFKTTWHLLVSMTSQLATTAITSISAMALAAKALYQQVKNHKNTRVGLKWAALGLAGAGLFVLMINTAVHLIPSGEAPPLQPLPEQPVDINVTDPFTLQVAAYLKVEHAKKFVATLKSQGLEAYYTEAKSTKSKWFQVRISHFPTKEAARVHGEALKAKGIIDDFYVANYEKQ